MDFVRIAFSILVPWLAGIAVLAAAAPPTGARHGAMNCRGCSGAGYLLGAFGLTRLDATPFRRWA